MQGEDDDENENQEQTRRRRNEDDDDDYPATTTYAIAEPLLGKRTSRIIEMKSSTLSGSRAATSNCQCWTTGGHFIAWPRNTVTHISEVNA